MAELKLRQIRSTNGASRTQRDTLRSLGLRKINQTVEHEDSPQLRGMVHAVRHLVEVDDG